MPIHLQNLAEWLWMVDLACQEIADEIRCGGEILGDQKHLQKHCFPLNTLCAFLDPVRLWHFVNSCDRKNWAAHQQSDKVALAQAKREGEDIATEVTISMWD